VRVSGSQVLSTKWERSAGDFGRIGRDYAEPRELLHEQIQEARIYSLQWRRDANTQFTAERCFARLSECPTPLPRGVLRCLLYPALAFLYRLPVVPFRHTPYIRELTNVLDTRLTVRTCPDGPSVAPRAGLIFSTARFHGGLGLFLTTRYGRASQNFRMGARA